MNLQLISPPSVKGLRLDAPYYPTEAGLRFFWWQLGSLKRPHHPALTATDRPGASAAATATMNFPNARHERPNLARRNTDSNTLSP
jgi:hypothetical protein